MCAVRPPKQPPVSHQPSHPPSYSFVCHNLDANPYNPNSQSSGSGKRSGRNMNSTDSLPPSTQCSQRSGGPSGPTGKLPRRLDRTGRQFLLRPVLGHFRTAGLSKDHRPHKVRHYYAILIKGPQGTVVDCRSPDRDGGDL